MYINIRLALIKHFWEERRGGCRRTVRRAWRRGGPVWRKPWLTWTGDRLRPWAWTPRVSTASWCGVAWSRYGLRKWAPQWVRKRFSLRWLWWSGSRQRLSFCSEWAHGRAACSGRLRAGSRSPIGSSSRASSTSFLGRGRRPWRRFLFRAWGGRRAPCTSCGRTIAPRWAGKIMPHALRQWLSWGHPCRDSWNPRGKNGLKWPRRD